MKALIVANLAGFASFLIKDIILLQSMGYEVSFAANGNKFEWSDTKERLDALGVDIIQIDFDSKNAVAGGNLTSYRQMKELLSSAKYDLIHCHTPIAGIITRFAARKQRAHGTKVIYSTHGFTFTSYSSKKTWLVYYSIEKFFSLFCDAIITINKEDYANAKKNVL